MGSKVGTHRQTEAEKIKARGIRRLLFGVGSDLLSHTATRAVPSAQKVLTSVFGMGTGVTPSL